MRDNIPWLVKSSGRILGPYRADEIAGLLRTREISVLDEVAEPLRRWQTIQYHKQFKDIVESLRKASLSEKTEATWTPHGENTMGLTQTSTDLGGDLTEEVDLDGFSATGKEIVINNVQEQTQLGGPSSAGRYQPQFSPQNAAIEKQVEKTTRGLWIVTAVVLVGAIAYMLQKRPGNTQSETRVSGGNLKQVVVSMIQTGQYAEALKELKSHISDPAQAGDLAIYYGSLLIQVEGQTVVGRRLLHSVIQSKRPEVKQAYTGLGLADLIDGQLDAADGNFQKALSVDAEYVPAIVNRAALFLNKGDYRMAKALASQALKLSPFQGEALLILSEASLYLAKASNNLTELGSISRMIQDFQTRQWDYWGELGFYRLYFDFLRNDRGMDEKIESYLDGDPRLTADHRHNVFIYRGRTQWKIMSRMCEQMVEKLGGGARASAFASSCFAREGRWDAARRKIETAVHQSPRDPLIQAWYAHVVKESGDGVQASIILGSATKANRRGEYSLPSLLQARFCQEKEDVDCARAAYQALFERDLNYLPALAGLAWVHAKRKNHAEASRFIETGLKVSPDYIPLLVLRNQAESDGWYGSK